ELQITGRPARHHAVSPRGAKRSLWGRDTMRKLRLLVCGVVVANLAACREPLVVDNQNQADKDRTLATAADLETFIGSTYAVAHQGTFGGNDGLQTQLMVMAFENVSALANFGMGPRGAIPRTPIDNTPNAAGDAGNLPDIWVKGNALTSDQFIRLIRSYKARFRAGVARTPADRADVGAGGTVDWNQVILDADSGLTADLIIAMDPSAGWDMVWVAQHYATGSANWHQMSQFILGMADTSGGYDTWLSTTRFNRAPFLVVSPDRRLPQGATRAAQVGDTLRPGFRSFYVGTSANPGRPFVRNR